MKTCTGDCLQCPAQQRVYCAAQMSRNAIESLTRVERRLEEIEDKLNSLEKDKERLIEISADGIGCLNNQNENHQDYEL